MRSGGWSVQQALAPDAAAVMRQAASAARRRGHAQVTPLHVAGAALAADAGLLRGACLRSSSCSHAEFQCKALELCLNVALGRLATAAAAFGPFQQPRAPALSNALAAAFKRAQASQRRGGGGGSAAAGKVELEQLVISILDDPSVSRVMREAGFSSAEVRANVIEKAVGVSSERSSPNPPNTKGARTDAVLDGMAASGGNKCVVVVGESAAAAEGVVKSVVDTVRKGNLELRHERLNNLQFVPVSFASFRRMATEEVEAGAGDLLLALVRRANSGAGKGVVLVIEDIGVAAEAWAAAAAASRGRSDRHGHDYYCAVEHAVMELSRMLRGGDHDHEHHRFWLLAFGDQASYAACKAGQPSLESVLEMHPVVVPQGSLALSPGGDSELTFCGTDTIAPAPASLPSWLRRCQGPVLSGSDLTLSFSSTAVASSISGCDPNTIPNPWHDHLEQRQQQWLNHGQVDPTSESHHDLQQRPASPDPGSSNSASKSISSGGVTEAAAARRRRPRFTELTAENLKILCSSIEARVPRHGGVAPGVASAVLQRRSGVATRRRRAAAPARRPSSAAAATWLLFQGPEGDGKAAVARELARLVFGSHDAFAIISPATEEFADKPPPADRSGSGQSSGGGEGELGRRRRKRPRPSSTAGYLQQRFHDAIRENPHRVVLIDGAAGRSDDDDDGIKSAIATGTVRASNGVDVASLEDAIVVLSCDCEVFESWSRALSPRKFKPSDDDDESRGVTRPRLSLDLNACAIDDGDPLEEGGNSLDAVDILDAVDGVFSFQ